MNFIRWILFIPLAFIAALLGSTILNLVWQFVLGDGKIMSGISWLLSGGIASYFWMLTGMIVAPIKNNRTKWILLSLLFLVSVLSIAGSAFVLINGGSDYTINTDFNPDWGRLILGIGMLIFSLRFITLEPSHFDTTDVV